MNNEIDIETEKEVENEVENETGKETGKPKKNFNPSMIFLAFVFLIMGNVLLNISVPMALCLYVMMFFAMLGIYIPDKKTKPKNNVSPERYKRHCPICNSDDYQVFVEQIQTSGKYKTRNSINLNPLHPLTFSNSNTKQIKNGTVISRSRFVCNVCGNIFD